MSHRCDARDQAIEGRRRQQFEAGLAGPAPSLGIDDLGTGAPAGHELGDHLGRVLQIRVQDDHGGATGVIEPGGDGHLVAKVA